MDNRANLINMITTGRDTEEAFIKEVNGVFRVYLPASSCKQGLSNFIEVSSQKDAELVLSLMGGNNE